MYIISRNLPLKPPHIGIVAGYRVVWYCASLLMYGWFLSQIANDIFVWHKPISQISPTNYVGAIVAMALIWAGTKLFKIPQYIVVEQPRRQNLVKDNELIKPKRRQSKLSSIPLQRQQATPVQPESPTQPKQEEMPIQPVQTVPSILGCTRRLGYLHQTGNTKEIPDQCLICKDLIQCLSSTGK